jgi:hypothetical protein
MRLTGLTACRRAFALYQGTTKQSAERLGESPEGTVELSPGRQSWVVPAARVVPKGRLKSAYESVLGSSQPSLRDSHGVFPQPVESRPDRTHETQHAFNIAPWICSPWICLC